MAEILGQEEGGEPVKRKQWRIFLAVAVIAGVLGAAGCGNKADDAVSVMANAEIDGEMQTGTETQTGEAEAGSSGESQDSEPAVEASTPLTSQAGSLDGNVEESLPKFVTDFINVNLNLAKSTIEGIKLERKEAEARAEAERKEAERKEAEARAAEEKAQAEAAITILTPAPSDPDTTYHDAGSIDCMYSLLEKVNEDRANNGVAELQWSDSLAQYCKDRIPVVEYNIMNGLWAHEGASQTENEAHGAIFTSSEVNQGWINSEGHHNSRINSGYTMYAAAAYQNPETGLIIWIEAFE